MIQKSLKIEGVRKFRKIKEGVLKPKFQLSAWIKKQNYVSLSISVEIRE